YRRSGRSSCRPRHDARSKCGDPGRYGCAARHWRGARRLGRSSNISTSYPQEVRWRRKEKTAPHQEEVSRNGAQKFVRRAFQSPTGTLQEDQQRGPRRLPNRDVTAQRSLVWHRDSDGGRDRDGARLQESLGIAARNSSSISSFCGGNSWCYSCNTLKINGALQRIDNAPCAMPTACVALGL